MKLRGLSFGAIAACALAVWIASCAARRESPAERQERERCEASLASVVASDGITAKESELLAKWHYETQFGSCFEQKPPVDSGDFWSIQICGGYGGCWDSRGEPIPADPEHDYRVSKETGEIRMGSNPPMSAARTMQEYRRMCFEISRDPPPKPAPEKIPPWKGGAD